MTRPLYAIREPMVPDRDHPGEAERIWALLDLELLAAIGFRPGMDRVSVPLEHPVFGYRPCDIEGCLFPQSNNGLCVGCRLRFVKSDMSIEEFLGRGLCRDKGPAVDLCLVCRRPGFERVAHSYGLCVSCDVRRYKRGQSVAAYVDGDERFPPAAPRPSLGVCTALACSRLAATSATRLCLAHQRAWLATGREDLDGFRREAAPVEGALVNAIVFAGVGDLARNEVLFGLQHAARVGRRWQVSRLRVILQALRSTGSVSIRDLDITQLYPEPRRFVKQTLIALDRAVRSRESERHEDVWDLTVWGHRGWLSFVGATTHSRRSPPKPLLQPWLKDTVKCWADQTLCRTRTASAAAHGLRGAGLWSDYLDRRPDRGMDPSQLGRADIADFILFLRSLQRGGRITGHARLRALRGLRQVLAEGRSMGLTDAGQPLHGLAAAVAFRPGDIESMKTVTPEDEVGDAIPEAVLAQMLRDENLAAMSPGFQRRLKIALEIGRRPSEVCGLRFNCVTHDRHTNIETGVEERRPTLIYEAFKVSKRDCRLPISEATAELIRHQQDDLRVRYPNTDPADLALFPTPVLNPLGRKAMCAEAWARELRAWADSLELYEGSILATGQLVLLREAGGPVRFDSKRIFPYAFRHTYAQRHVDHGTLVEVLKDLLGHANMDTTAGYYRIRAGAKRRATDRILRLQVAVNGPLASLEGPNDTDAIRYDLGRVSVPMGTCVEPSNVKASGRACIYRHRCFGCQHFRTDPSYLVELHGYLDSLLQDRERLLAAVDGLEEWARQDALPSDGEIAAVRRLIEACEARLNELPEAERTMTLTAIDELRRGRDMMAGAAPVQFRHRVRQPEPTVFPAAGDQAEAAS